MPEFTIVLCPVGGQSRFLSRDRERLGLVLGRAGARFNESDAIGIGLADHAIASGERSALLSRLAVLEWTGSGDPREQIDLLLTGLHGEVAARLPAPVLLPHQQRVDALLAGRTLQGVLARLFEAQFDEQEAVLQQAQQLCRTGSPISRAILWRQYWQARRNSLAEVFAEELTLSVNCVLKGDFVEGVRALLIDKDKDPRWQQLPPEGEWLDEFYRWPQGRNPLACKE